MTRAVSPRTGERIGPEFSDSTIDEIDEAIGRAAYVAEQQHAVAPIDITFALRAAAAALDVHADGLVAIADAETALGEPRLTSEVARTTNQLRIFANLATGNHLDAVISRPPAGAPAKDVRRVNRPLGVVAVFEASNYPFVFGGAGGDTESALAAGSPAVAKAHPAQPGTSQLVADTIAAALTGAGLPDGLSSWYTGRRVRSAVPS